MDVAASAQSVVPNWRGLMPSAFDARSSRGAADQTQRRCLSIQYGKAPSDESFSEFRNFVHCSLYHRNQRDTGLPLKLGGGLVPNWAKASVTHARSLAHPTAGA
jgi:hypothetical protein